MASKSEIQRQMDELAAQLETADDDDEVWVERGGTRTLLRGEKARGHLDKLKDLWGTDDPGAGDGGDGGAGGAAKKTAAKKTTSTPPPPPASGGGGYFTGRKSS